MKLEGKQACNPWTIVSTNEPSGIQSLQSQTSPLDISSSGLVQTHYCYLEIEL